MPGVAVTDTVRGATSAVGLTESHGTSAEAVKFSVPPPVFVTVNDFVSPVAAPWVAANASAVGATASAGGGSTVKVTGISRGEPVAPGAVTVIVAVWVPAARLPVAAATVIEPAPGVTVSHGASSETAQFRPPLETVSVFVVGSAPPRVAVNARLDGVTDSVGGAGGATVSVTGTVFGEPVAPGALIVTVAVYVPAARPFVDGVTVTVPGPEPFAGETASQSASSAAVQLSVPVPSLPTEIVFASGLGPPWSAANDSVLGVTPSTGSAGPDEHRTGRSMSAPSSSPDSARS